MSGSIDKIAFKQSPAEQVRLSTKAWRLDENSIEARLNGLIVKKNRLIQEFETKHAQDLNNKINAIQLEIDPIQEKVKEKEGNLSNLRSTYVGMIAYIISNIFVINLLIYCFSDLKQSYEEQTTILNEIDKLRKVIKAKQDEIDQTNKAAWNYYAMWISSETRRLSNRIDDIFRKIKNFENYMPCLKRRANAVGVVRDLIKGQQVSQLNIPWINADSYVDDSWKNKFLEEAKKLMNNENTSLCTATYAFHNMCGVSDRTCVVFIKKSTQVQMLYQNHLQNEFWGSAGDEIVHFETKDFRLYRQAALWDPVNDQAKTEELRKVIQA